MQCSVVFHILMEYFYLGSVSCITALVFLKNSKHRTDINENESDSEQTEKDEADRSKLRSLQTVYLPAHLLALFSDWLQGPYVYQLYREYGHGEKEIAVLFMTGQWDNLSNFLAQILECSAIREEPKILRLVGILLFTSCARLHLLLSPRRLHRAPG